MAPRTNKTKQARNARRRRRAVPSSSSSSSSPLPSSSSSSSSGVADTIVVAVANPSAAAPPASDGGAVPAGGTITVGPGAALPAHCERPLRHSRTAQRMWLAPEAYAFPVGQGCIRCQNANQLCTVTGAAQCAYCTAQGFGSGRQCSLSGSGLNVGASSQTNAQLTTATSSGEAASSSGSDEDDEPGVVVGDSEGDGWPSDVLGGSVSGSELGGASVDRLPSAASSDSLGQFRGSSAPAESPPQAAACLPLAAPSPGLGSATIEYLAEVAAVLNRVHATTDGLAVTNGNIHDELAGLRDHVHQVKGRFQQTLDCICVVPTPDPWSALSVWAVFF